MTKHKVNCKACTQSLGDSWTPHQSPDSATLQGGLQCPKHSADHSCIDIAPLSPTNRDICVPGIADTNATSGIHPNLIAPKHLIVLRQNLIHGSHVRQNLIHGEFWLGFLAHLDVGRPSADMIAAHVHWYKLWHLCAIAAYAYNHNHFLDTYMYMCDR